MLIAVTSRSHLALCECGAMSMDLTYDPKDTTRLAFQCQSCYKWAPCQPEDIFSFLRTTGGLQATAGMMLQGTAQPEAHAS